MREARVGLRHQMREVLAQLELVSHGTITNYNPSGGGGESEQALPAGGSGAEHLKWRRLFERATSDKERRTLIDQAWQELEQLRGRVERPVPTGETLEQRNSRIVKDGEGYTVREVAIAFRCGEREVRKARTAAGREPERGLEPESPDRARIVELAAQGRTVASLVIQFGLSRSTIERYLGKRGKRAA